MTKSINSPGEISSLILESDAYQIYQRLIVLDTNFFVLEKNFRDLKMTIETFSDPKNVHFLLDPDEAQTVLRHIIRMFHNYVAAAMSLVEHTRIMINEWYENDDFLEEYNAQIKSRFSENHLTNFIQALRNYTLHYSLPISSLNLSVKRVKNTEEVTEEISYFIEKAPLLKWSGWKKGEVFLSTAEKHILILELADEYYIQISDFHNWLHQRLNDIHSNELNWLYEMQNRIDEILKKPIL